MSNIRKKNYCYICHRHVDELEPFEEISPLDFDPPEHQDWIDENYPEYLTDDKKLGKKWREYMGGVSSMWECRDCYYLSDFGAFMRQRKAERGKLNLST